MRPLPTAPARLAILIGIGVSTLTSLAGGPAHAEGPANPMARLFGVGPSSARAELEQLAARLRVNCRAAPAVTSGTPPREAVPVVCAVAPANVPVMGPVTYWYEDDALSRAFFIDGTPTAGVADLRARFDLLERWIEGALGRPVAPLALPPGWGGTRPLSDAEQTQLLLTGKARLSLTWSRPDGTVELWLAGESGRPVLAFGLRAAARPNRPKPEARCAPEAINDALLDLFSPSAPAARARAASRLAACKVTRAKGALLASAERDESTEVKEAAKRALVDLDAAPPRAPEAPPEPVAGPPAPAPVVVAAAPTAEPDVETSPPARVPGAPEPAADEPPTLVTKPLAPPAETKPDAPVSGTPLAIAASTVAGATFMRNLGLTAGPQLSGVTPQLLLGSAGAVIGFGTSWGLSRFGLRPTVEQAAWYTNTTAWGTLAGIGFWSATGSDSPKIKYGLPAAGEALGMAVGAWSSVKWRWTAQQMIVADSFLVGAGLMSASVPLLRDAQPHLTLAHAFGAPVLMVGSAVAARYLDPTSRDVGLMTTTALAGGWTGALIASGIADEDFLGSRPSWGGAALGLGAGYLAGAAAGAFVEASPASLGIGTAGMLTGNVLGVGLHLTLQGFSRESVPGASFSSAEIHARAISAGVGGLAVAAAGAAYAPYLRPGPSATSMTITGALYGAGTWWLASAASYHGQPLSDVDDARLAGGLLMGASLGGLTGLVSSRWFAPDGSEQVLAAGSAALGMGAGLGIAKLATDTQGTPDAVGVILGTGVGLGAGMLVAPRVQLRAPDAGGGAVGLATGFTVGRLLPTIRWTTWQDSRESAGGTLLGMSLGLGAGVATAHLTNATGGEVGIVGAAGAFGLLSGLGAGYLRPCQIPAPCTSQPPRVGALVGTVGLMGVAMAFEPRLHLATTLGPDATTLGFLGGGFGFFDGLLLAGTLDESGVVSGTSARQAWGGILFGASTEAAAGIVASKWLRLQKGDGLFLTSGKVTGALFGLGLSLVARDQTGRADTLSTLTGSIAGLAAAGAAQMYTPLRRTDAGAAATGATFGTLVGALLPGLDERTWSGLGHRTPGGAALLGLSVGAIGGAAVSHASDASSGAVGLSFLGGVDGLATGLGLGLLFTDETTDFTGQPSSRPVRTGLVVGTTAGLGIGALVWPRLTFGPGDKALTATSTTLGAWMGLWLPTLGHANVDVVSAETRWGAVLAGAGLASFGSSLLTPAVEVDADLLGNAVAMDALWSGAGAGAGALLSERDDAPVWGMLGAGVGGLVVGGALHESLELGGEDAPLLTLAGAEGLWLGSWLPYALHERSAVTERERAGAMALGGFGSLGLAAVATSGLELQPSRAGYGALGSALGASLGGGIGLLSPSLQGRGGVGLMLGGTGLGLTTGLLVGPLLAEQPGQRVIGGAAAGASLGVAESLLFAWSGRASGDAQYGGAALVGGGLGATLGVAAAVAPTGERSAAPAAAGFAAWGAWMGAFTGSLVSYDSHETVMGGLIGANVGFVAGYGLLQADLVEPRDFGWLSLFGALGTGLGAGVAAPFASGDSTAIRAGLAIGPVVGMITGALVLPRVRALVGPTSSAPLASGRAATRRARLAAQGRIEVEDDRAGERDESLAVAYARTAHAAGATTAPSSLGRKLSQVGSVTDWAPLVGAMPAPAEQGPPPMLFGLTGHWK